MKFPRARRVCRPLPALLLALAACAIRSTPPGRPDPPSAASMPELLLGEPVERELAAGEKHVYRLDAPPGSYLRIVAEPRAMDVALTLVGPEGEPLAAADGPGGSKQRELLSTIAARGGSLRLVVERKDQGEPRSHSLKLEARRAALPTDEVRVRAERLFNGAYHLQSLGTADSKREAVAAFEQSLALWEQLGEAPGQADSLNEAGLVLHAQGNVQEAVARYQRAEALSQAAGYRYGEGKALNNLGLAYARLGEPEKTLDSYRRALAIWRQEGIVAEAARTLHNLGLFHNQRGEPRRALEAFEEALPLWRAAGELDGEAYTLNSLGVLDLLYRGETSLALERLYRALTLSKEAGSPEAQAYVTSNLALAHRTRGEFQQALDLYAEAVTQWEVLGDATSLGNIREALAGLRRDLGELEPAADEYRKVLELYRKAGSRDFEARALTSLGWVESLSGQSRAALQHHRQALAISRDTGNRRIEGMALHRMGIAQLALGELDAALASLQGCVTMRRDAGNRVEEASALLDLGVVQHRLGLPGAELNLGQALELARRSENAILQASILLRWAGIDRDGGRLEEARLRLEEALAIVESGRQEVASRDLRATYFAARREYYDAYVDVLMRQGRGASGSHAARAFDVSERARARSLLELLAEGRIDVRRGIAPELREREKRAATKISSTQSRLVDLLSRPQADAEEIAGLRRELGSALDELKELESEIRLAHPRYAEVRYPPVATLAQVQQALDPETVLLEYVLGPDASYLFVVTARRFEAHRLPPAVGIAEEVRRLLQTLRSPERRLFGQFLLSAHRLYQLLIAPAAGVLEEHSRLVVVADGALHLLPFEVLVGKPSSGESGFAGLPWLLRTHVVSYTPSASVLLSLHAQRAGAGGGVPATAKNLVAFADPVLPRTTKISLASSDGGGLAELPESRREVEAIAKLFAPHEVSLYLGREATEDAVKRQGAFAGTRRIHFATHALLSDVRPELSGLVLTRADDSAEDGLLQVYEIFNLDLDSELVVLSACESGLGRAVAGEGLVGLARAFLYAGTPRLVVSLWPVGDASTADLMIDFYGRLQRGIDTAAALRAAKLRSAEREERAHPYYWAPFVLLGEASELSPM